MITINLLANAERFMALAAEEDKPSDKPTLPIPYTTDAEIAGVPSSRPQSEAHALRKENRELRLYLSLLLNEPYVSQYTMTDIKTLVEKKLRG